MSPKIDIVYPCHAKDKDTLKLAIKYARKNVKNLNNIYYVSKTKLTDDAIWVNEDIFPFSYKDMINKIGNHNRTGWYYAGWIHLYSTIIIENTMDYVLICDADTIFCNEVEFVNIENQCLFNISPGDGTPLYFEHMKKLVPGLTPQTPRPWSCISHHMIVNKDILKHMMKTVEKIHNKPFWEAWIDVTKEKYATFHKEGTKGYIDNDRHKNGPGRATSYELYCQYALKYFKDNILIRKFPAVLAYKGHLNVKGENFTKTHVSRTNLSVYNNKIQIIDPKIELENEFETLEDALEFHISVCSQKGFTQVTFQNHTRQGSNNVTGNGHGDKR